MRRRTASHPPSGVPSLLWSPGSLSGNVSLCHAGHEPVTVCSPGVLSTEAPILPCALHLQTASCSRPNSSCCHGPGTAVRNPGPGPPRPTPSQRWRCCCRLVKVRGTSPQSHPGGPRGRECCQRAEVRKERLLRNRTAGLTGPGPGQSCVRSARVEIRNPGLGARVSAGDPWPGRRAGPGRRHGARVGTWGRGRLPRTRIHWAPVRACLSLCLSQCGTLPCGPGPGWRPWM